MATLGHESRMMQNAALGAVILWRFSRAYTAASHRVIPMPLLFLPLPLIWHEATAEHIRSTQFNSGLRKFAEKFSEPSSPELDILLDLQRRATVWRSKTLQSFRVCLGTGLLRLEPAGSVKFEDVAWSPQDCNVQTRKMCFAAEKIGAWFAPLTLREISLALHVNF